ncbi:ASCH domain-containing protein [Peribacillus asahii]|uniref:ASCH domain-containing protein n=1 Tax=Peribacillus asahii TaxID=228899 RepID=UPI00207A623E|nr:ASCH domain-containing protein [Peribacillus asahii]USK71724.1 ASCH domain-containing protein [Peribacillus asahii]
MIHEMSLYDKYYEKVKENKKTYEVRLYDEKRRKINIGDTIVFRRYSCPSEVLRVKVRNIIIFPSFDKLYKFVPLKLAGFENDSVEDAMKQIYGIYSKDQEEKWGVILIEIGSDS